MPIEQSTRGSNMDFRGRDSNDEVDGAAVSKAKELIIGTSSVRKIIINGQAHEPFMGNVIHTGKYNYFTFLPKFLYEQFRRYANIFFLCIGLLQQIPNVSPTGRFVTIVPFTIILILTAMKEIVEDIKRHRADDKVNNSIVEVLSPQGHWEKKAWKEVVVGDIVKVDNDRFFPADLVIISSSEPQGMCYIETSNLDGETNLKIRSALQQTCDLDSGIKLAEVNGLIECELPNREIYDFKGNITLDGAHSVPLTPSTILLRGAKLRNTAWIHGVVVYTGHETKLLLNSTQTPLKRSNIDKITNTQIIFLFFILIAISVLSAGANAIQETWGQDHTYLGKLVNNNFFFNWLTFFILYNNLIPISLQVSLEFVKFIQAYFINWDEEMYHEESQTYANARTSNLNEELGQIKYVFSDKTGTLTRNIMEFKKCSVAGTKYSVLDAAEDEQGSPLICDLKDSERAETIELFLVLMAVCHTVIPEVQEGGGVHFNASSPDEKALVEGAQRYGYKFLARKPESVVIQTPNGEEEEYQVLNVIEFTSTRKRMSVIVKDPKDRIRLLTKGADTMIFERLGDTPESREYLDSTLDHLEEFAQSGLRTLCLAMRDIGATQYENWNKIYQEAERDINNKEEMTSKAAEQIEMHLTLVGATAIEDKLQDGVPETIAQLIEANIHVWVLTGDKQETAINIGHSCRLLTPEMPKIIINSTTLSETRDEITEQLVNFQREGLVGKDNPVSVIIDGKSLTFALDPSLKKDFLELCCSCQSVICCRVSPIQKAEVVQLVQEKQDGAISLAIGDGANDVAMIQKADVGVGISGNEGLQAANSSDFAIAQFRFLARLLFVHGAWSYTRVSKVILYSFYKNICLYVIELWFAIYSYWSGQVLFERWTIGMYNIFFTSLPPFAMGLFDQYCSAETRMKHPSLYHSSQKSEYFNLKVFWTWIGTSILHSMFLYWITMHVYGYGIVWSNAKDSDYLVLGNMVYTYVVITVCCKAGLEMDSWSWISHLFIWGSIAFWMIFLIVYSYVWPMGVPFAANMAGMIELLFTTPVYWLCLILVPFTTLLPDIAYKAIRVTAWTTETDKIRMAEIMRRDVSAYVESGGGRRKPLTENSTLLRNVRKVFSRRSSARSSVLAAARAGSRPGTTATGAAGGSGVSEDFELQGGYAFSQEEGGAVSQTEYIRRYSNIPKGKSRRGEAAK